MNKKYFIIIFLLFILTICFFYQYFIYYISESLEIIIQDDNIDEIKTIKNMFNIEETKRIKKMTYTPGFPEGYNLEIIIYDEKVGNEQKLLFNNPSAYSEQKSFLEYLFESEGKPPVQLSIYRTLIIINIICIITLLILCFVKK